MPGTTALTAKNTLSLDRSPELAITALLRSAIGPINADYYLPILSRFEVAGRAGLSWNWAASGCTLNWMLFRQLWGAAFLYVTCLVGVPLLTLGLTTLVWGRSESVELALLLIGLVLSFVIPGVLGNAMFHSKSLKSMAAALEATSTLEGACAKLQQQSSSRQRFIWLIGGNAALACLLGLAYGVISHQSSPRPEGVRRVLPHNAVSGIVSSPAVAPASEAVVPVAVPVPVATVAVAVAAISAPASSQTVPKTNAVVVAPKTAPEPARPIAANAARFYVNVGLFAMATNAQHAQAKVMASGLPALTQTVKSRKGQLTRVQAGPFDSRALAEQAAKRIQALELEATVVQQ